MEANYQLLFQVLIEAIQNYYLDKPNLNFMPNIPPDRLTPKRLAVSKNIYFSIQFGKISVRTFKNMQSF